MTEKERTGDAVAPVYLLTGVEQLTLDEAMETIERRLKRTKEIETIHYDMEEVPVEAVVEEANLLPFLAEHKLIIAKNASFLKASERSKEKVVHHLPTLEQWLDSPSPTATVVFVAPYEKLDGRKKITKRLKKVASVVEANRLEGQELVNWLKASLIKEEVTMDEPIMHELIGRVGENVSLLQKELEKLTTYVGPNSVITEQMIQELVTRTPEMDVFALTDAYVKGNRTEALHIYHDLLFNGEEPIMLTALIAGQIRLMLNVQTLRKKGFERNQMAKTLKVHPFRITLIMRMGQLPPSAHLLRMLSELADVDYSLKSSGMRRDRPLELFLMDRSAH